MRRMAIIAVAVLVLTACSSGEGDPASEETADPGGSQAAPASQAPAASTGDGGGDDGGSGGPSSSGLGSASVTIGSTTYRFGETSFPALRCDTDMFGLFWVLLGAVDDSGAEVTDGGLVTIILLREGTDPDVVDQRPEIEVDVRPFADDTWIASEEEAQDRGLDPGTSQVDSYTISGNSVSGTATFYSENSYFESTGGGGEIETAQGSFEATCNE